MKTEEKKISIIIPARNEEKQIGRTIKEIKKQDYKNYEIIVVDGNSSDKTREIAKKLGARVIKETGKVKSLPNARNLGVSKAKGDIILMIDSDWEIQKNFLKEANRTFSKKEVLAASVNKTFSRETTIEKILFSKVNAPLVKKERRMIPILTRKGFIESIGNWDEKLGYGEDKDIYKRMKKFTKKGQIADVKKATIKLHNPQTLKELWAQQKWYGKTILFFLKKNYSLKEILVLTKTFYLFIIIAPLLALFNISSWIFLAILSSPLIFISLLRTIKALAKGDWYGLGILPIDIFMATAFTYGLMQYFYDKKDRGRK